jgi:DNA-directed RNA polymerase specialized sigma24 family protein
MGCCGVDIAVMKDLEAEFEQFVRVRAPSLLRMAVLLAGDVDQAEDLLQQTLWRVYSRWTDAFAHPDAYARVVLANQLATMTITVVPRGG